MPSQNVSLPSELVSFVGKQIKSGRYASASEVHRSALRHMQEAEEQKNLQRERVNLLLREGEKDLEEGRYTSIDATISHTSFLDEIDGEVTHELKEEYA
jgi:antitoxin ParD1/3/4